MFDTPSQKWRQPVLALRPPGKIHSALQLVIGVCSDFSMPSRCKRLLTRISKSFGKRSEMFSQSLPKATRFITIGRTGSALAITP